MEQDELADMIYANTGIESRCLADEVINYLVAIGMLTSKTIICQPSEYN